MHDFFRGAVRAVGIVAGFLPAAVSFGAIAIQANLSPLIAVTLSMWIFAGASQFAAVEAIRQGLPWLSIVLTVWVVNLRHVPMSLAIARQRYQSFPRWQRWLLTQGLVDECFALEMSDEPRSFAYYLGMHLFCWLAWVAGTFLGAQVGMQIPARWLAFALPALFIYLLINAIQQVRSQLRPTLQHQQLWWVVGTGIALTLLLLKLGSTGILLAIVGIAMLATWRLKVAEES